MVNWSEQAELVILQRVHNGAFPIFLSCTFLYYEEGGSNDAWDKVLSKMCCLV